MLLNDITEKYSIKFKNQTLYIIRSIYIFPAVYYISNFITNVILIPIIFPLSLMMIYF